MQIRICVPVVALMFLLGACASSGTMVTEQQVSQFQKGVTTRAEVISALGNPQASTRQSTGLTIDVYQHIKASANAASFVPVVGLLAGGATASTNTVTFSYEIDGKLKSIDTTTASSAVNTGLLNQN